MSHGFLSELHDPEKNPQELQAVATISKCLCRIGATTWILSQRFHVVIHWRLGMIGVDWVDWVIHVDPIVWRNLFFVDNHTFCWCQCDPTRPATSLCISMSSARSCTIHSWFGTEDPAQRRSNCWMGTQRRVTCEPVSRLVMTPAKRGKVALRVESLAEEMSLRYGSIWLVS